jgi:hypothetical protein
MIPEPSLGEPPRSYAARFLSYEWNTRGLWPRIAGALAFRGAAYAIMTALALWNELRPAPTVPDLLVAHLPYLGWVDRVNYLAWLLLYPPLSALFLALQPRRWIRYMITGGLVSLLRGVCIALTGLGPPDPVHAGPGLGGEDPLTALLELLSPWGVFAHGSARAYLTKDLFFSGHVATTFLLVLYLWPRPRLRWAALAAHLVVLGTVLFAHLHYGIDIAGGYAVTFALFALREGWPRQSASPSRPL